MSTNNMLRIFGLGFAFGLVASSAMAAEFGVERRRFQGPPVGEQIERRYSEIAAQERVVGEAG